MNATPFQPPPYPHTSQPQPVSSEVDRIAHTRYLESRLDWLVKALAGSEDARARLLENQQVVTQDLTERLGRAREEVTRAVGANKRLAGNEAMLLAQTSRLRRERNEARAAVEEYGRQCNVLREESERRGHALYSATAEHSKMQQEGHDALAAAQRENKHLREVMASFMQEAQMRFAEVRQERDQLIAAATAATRQTSDPSGEAAVQEEAQIVRLFLHFISYLGN